MIDSGTAQIKFGYGLQGFELRLKQNGLLKSY